ncbi:MAG: hypothetical protein ACYCOX_11745 [Acidobacteriaceae bacterium]
MGNGGHAHAAAGGGGDGRDRCGAGAQFEAARDVPRGGVLLAQPALLATGLLRFTSQIYSFRHPEVGGN